MTTLSWMMMKMGTSGAKDELCIVEAEAMNDEGRWIKVALMALKTSVQPRASLGL